LNNRGDLLRDLRRHEAAADDFTRLLNIRPNRDYVAGELFHVRNHCCDWGDYNSQFDRIVSGIHENKRVITPFSFTAVSDCAKTQFQCANIYADDKCSNSNKPMWSDVNYQHDKIRVAYLSADFYEHATVHLMMGLFEAHDKSRFETNAISFGPSATDELRFRLESAFTNFIEVHDKNDREVAALLREMEIDIAIDLKGHTGGARPRILSFRPAPVQVNYLGYPGTMGCDYIDYIIADPFLIPEDQHSFYTEKVVYLPDSYQPTDSGRRIDDETMTRSEAGLPEHSFVFCSFNNSYKITPRMFEIWLRLLDRVEGSVLWLLGENPAAIRNLRRHAGMNGIAPDRLVFAPRLAPSAHLARHRLADLMLDTSPYNAHTTASDALWAGLPLVTCSGASFAARVAGSLLRAVGLPELIAETLEDYEALAL
jgi:protein O-GlcNAc transferase